MNNKSPHKVIKKVEIEEAKDRLARAEIATLRGVCALLAEKYPHVLKDECRKLERKTA